MKGFGLWVLFLVLGTALICLLLAPRTGSALSGHRYDMDTTVPSRKLKENFHPEINHEDETSKMHLDDYRPNDPVPSSKASIRPGPIQHGTPLMPYIPGPSPPGPDQYVGFP